MSFYKKCLNLFLVFTFNSQSFCFPENSCFSGAVGLEETNTVDYCHKLNKHVLLLKKFDDFNKQKKIVDYNIAINAIVSEKNIFYKNEIIKNCTKKMKEQKTLDSFFETWDYLYGSCIENRNFELVREFSILIFSVYENLLTIIEKQDFKDSLSKTQIKGVLDDIIQVYNTIAELPIREIIATLEKCYSLFSKILNDYGLTSGLTFGQWIKKYWWLPPTVVFAIIAAVFSKAISSKIVKNF